MSQEFGFEPEEKSPSAKTKKGVLISVIAAIMLEIYVKNPFEYGCRSWFRHQAEGDKETHVTDIFRSPDLKRVVHTMFLRDLSVFLHYARDCIS